MPSTINTRFFQIPDFGAVPTVTAVASGAWSDTATWDTEEVPVADDIVQIPQSFTVTYDVSVDERIDTVSIENGGSLRFSTSADTKLLVANLVVKFGGELTIGTPSAPVASNKTAQLVFADAAIDTEIDPYTFGHSLIGLGKVTICGAAVANRFQRLAAEALEGDDTILLSTADASWIVGNRLVFTDSRQLAEGNRWGAYTHNFETRVIDAIDGVTVTLDTALEFNHKGARTPDNVLRLLPHVGKLSSNVTIKSEDSEGVRGMVLFTDRAEVDIQYASFQGLGRTLSLVANNTTWPAGAIQPTIGTNEEHRCAVNFVHLLGPVAAPSHTYQFRFKGNSVHCLMDPQLYRWGINLFDSSYGLIQNNISYNWLGACMTVSGAMTTMVYDGIEYIISTGSIERDNLIDGNFFCRSRGDVSPRNNVGRDGIGLWVVGFDNRITNNVASGCSGDSEGIVSGSGFNIFVHAAWGASNTLVKRPSYQGADWTKAGQFELVNRQTTPILQFENNEAYGAMCTGMTLWHIGTDGYVDRTIGYSTIKNFVAWHFYNEAYMGYPTRRVIFDGFTSYGDIAQISDPYTLAWRCGDYRHSECVLKNFNCQGTRYGLRDLLTTFPTLTIQDSFFRCWLNNIEIETVRSPGSRTPITAKTTTITNCRFQSYPGNATFKTIAMLYNASFDGTNFVVQDDVFVYDYNGAAGDNFQPYYTEQAPSFVVPINTFYGPDINNDGIEDYPDSVGCPVAGLTNTQALAQYGVCIAGTIAPTTTTRSNITGYVRYIPPTVTDVAINGGDIQRSKISSIIVTFSTNVLPGDIPAAAIQILSSNGAAQSADVNYAVSAGVTKASITFPSSLPNGRMTLLIHADQMLNSAGIALDGTGAGVAGVDYEQEFHCLFGDFDGDGDVDQDDLDEFRNYFGAAIGSTNYHAYADANSNGLIDQYDYNALRSNFGTSV